MRRGPGDEVMAGPAGIPDIPIDGLVVGGTATPPAAPDALPGGLGVDVQCPLSSDRPNSHAASGFDFG